MKTLSLIGWVSGVLQSWLAFEGVRFLNNNHSKLTLLKFKGKAKKIGTKFFSFLEKKKEKKKKMKIPYMRRLHIATLLWQSFGRTDKYYSFHKHTPRTEITENKIQTLIIWNVLKCLTESTTASIFSGRELSN